MWNVENASDFRAGFLLPMDMSEQYLVSDCFTSTYDCSGGSVNSALNFIRDDGVVGEFCFPQENADSSCRPCALWEDLLWGITGHDRVDPVTRNLHAIAHHHELPASQPELAFLVCPE